MFSFNFLRSKNSCVFKSLRLFRNQDFGSKFGSKRFAHLSVKCDRKWCSADLISKYSTETVIIKRLTSICLRNSHSTYSLLTLLLKALFIYNLLTYNVFRTSFLFALKLRIWLNFYISETYRKKICVCKLSAYIVCLSVRLFAWQVCNGILLFF